MKPLFALFLCLPLIIWLWKRDQRVRPPFSPVLWIPLVWLLVLASRPVSWWLGIGGSGGGDLEGNSFDRVLYLGMIFVSIYVLSRRNFQWGTLIQQNKGLLLFYLFLGATIMWSEYSFVTFKRWFKDLGAIFIILIILTEEDPVEATKAVFARCAYVLFPLSVIFFKYFPSIGRQYASQGGTMFTGVATTKNSFGEILLVFGLVLLSELVQVNRPSWGRWFKGHHFTTLFILALGLWLLFISNSRTSQLCFMIGATIILGHKLLLLRGTPRRFLVLFLVAASSLVLFDAMFSVSDQLLGVAGRNSTLTERTDIWEAVKQDPADPIIGCGYMMYWSLRKGIQLDEKRFNVKSAHNGYLDTYLDGGALGICFLTVMLLAVGRRVIREFLTGSEYGRLAFAFFVVMLLTNIAESIYARRSPLWFAFLLFSLEFRHVVPRLSRGRLTSRSDAAPHAPVASGCAVPVHP